MVWYSIHREDDCSGASILSSSNLYGAQDYYDFSTYFNHPDEGLFDKISLVSGTRMTVSDEAGNVLMDTSNPVDSGETRCYDMLVNGVDFAQAVVDETRLFFRLTKLS